MAAGGFRPGAGKRKGLGQTKSIAADLPVPMYEALAAQRRAGESMSDTIRRVIAAGLMFLGVSGPFGVTRPTGAPTSTVVDGDKEL